LAEGDNYFQACHSLFFMPGAVSRLFLSPAHVKFFREGLCVMARIRRAMGEMSQSLLLSPLKHQSRASQEAPGFLRLK
jgi:hypothetical protein